ncbi:MAG: MerR family transcriptional regulator [Taibaiella sp.]|nr:MerR family transcriptional regulator [Taibaiella sp.]
MKGRVLTLFGEELQPEEIQAVGKSRAVKKPKAAATVKDNTKSENEDVKKDLLPADWNDGKQYYSIGEVAALFKVNTSNIRFWTKEFALKVRTTRKGDRLYTPAQVKEMATIYHLVKERGFTISGARTKLKAEKKVSIHGVDLKQSLLQLRNKLLTLKNNL